MFEATTILSAAATCPTRFGTGRVWLKDLAAALGLDGAQAAAEACHAAGIWPERFDLVAAFPEGNDHTAVLHGDEVHYIRATPATAAQAATVTLTDCFGDSKTISRAKYEANKADYTHYSVS